jgi:hypothetical protein
LMGPHVRRQHVTNVRQRSVSSLYRPDTGVLDTGR